MGILCFFWFPPMYVLPIVVIVGSLLLLREHRQEGDLAPS
jgi:hypothetical protein